MLADTKKIRKWFHPCRQAVNSVVDTEKNTDLDLFEILTDVCGTVQREIAFTGSLCVFLSA